MDLPASLPAQPECGMRCGSSPDPLARQLLALKLQGATSLPTAAIHRASHALSVWGVLSRVPVCRMRACTACGVSLRRE